MTADFQAGSPAAAPTSYAQPRLYRARPGLLTGLAVASIVAAVLSLIASGIIGLYGFGTLWFVKMATSYASASVYGTMGTPGTPGATTPGGPPAAVGAPSGIDSPTARRQIVVAVDSLHRLTASRQSQFDKLLAEVGQVVGFQFKPDGSPLDVRGDLDNFGKAPAAQEGARDIDYLITKAGRIELSDADASFSSLDGSVGYKTAVGTAGVAPLTTPWQLPAAEVQAVIDDAQTMSGSRLTAAQVLALRTALQAPNQRLVQPGTAGMITPQTTFDPSGTASINLGMNTLVVAQQGMVVSQGPTPLPLALTAASPEGAALVAFEAGLSIALAIYLFVTAILVLRQSPTGIRLLHMYAWLKIPLAIAGGIGVAWLWGSFAEGMESLPTESDQAVATAWGVAIGIAGLILPIAILIVLHSRGMKEYFAQTRRA